jgi:hypothetical protein
VRCCEVMIIAQHLGEVGQFDSLRSTTAFAFQEQEREGGADIPAP